MSLGRRLFIAGGGIGGFVPPPGPPPPESSGPYAPDFVPGATVLAQVHCHTNQSDGSTSPAQIVAAYLAAGYGALAITDHDEHTAQPAGITTAIPGDEYSPTSQHIIGVNPGAYDRGATTAGQTIIDGIVAGGGMAHIAHPRWSTGATIAELKAWTGYRGLEIHNSHVIVTGGAYSAFAFDQWDDLLTTTRRDVWGYAVDDYHKSDAYRVHDVGRLQVFASANTLSGVLASLASGNFVADVSNHGVTPGYPERGDDGVSLTCAGATRIEAIGASGVLLAAADADTVWYPFTGEEHYVRLQAVGDYTDPFDTLSDRWKNIDGTWAVSGGVLSLAGTDVARRIILRRQRHGDFNASVDIRIGSTGDDQAGLIFNVLDNSDYAYVHIGYSAGVPWRNQLAVGATTGNSFVAPPAGSTPLTVAPDTWYRLKVDYVVSTGTVRLKAWQRDSEAEPDWMVTAAITGWRHGAFGFRANRSGSFDNLYVNGFRTYYQPITVEAA